MQNRLNIAYNEQKRFQDCIDLNAKKVKKEMKSTKNSDSLFHLDEANEVVFRSIAFGSLPITCVMADSLNNSDVSISLTSLYYDKFEKKFNEDVFRNIQHTNGTGVRNDAV